MGELVGRIEWDAVEVATNARESGTLLVRLDDVKIRARNTFRWQKRLMEKMTAMKSRVGPDQIKLLTEEVQREPDAQEVAEVWYSKYLQLSATYHVGYADHCQTENRGGIGFNSGLGPIVEGPESCGLTFSWDWFTLTNDGIARKLQEDGQIHVEQSQTPNGSEITHMVFDSDVSLRITKRADPPKLDPDWRIAVHKGSEIYWPSLVDGQLAPNGFVA